MSRKQKETITSTLMVAFTLCLVCSIIVSTSAVVLKDKQVLNKQLDRKKNILLSAGLYNKEGSIETLFKKITPRIVNIEEGRYATSEELSMLQELGYDIENYDQKKASKDSQLSIALLSAHDIANIKRQERFSLAYFVENNNEIEQIILPIKGYGLWSTLYGFIAIDSDFNTINGLGFYEHGETPGLGGEVDNPLWKNIWQGKKLFDSQGALAIKVIKGTVNNNLSESIHQIDGLSGATLTTKGIDRLVRFWLGSQGFGPLLAYLKKDKGI